MGLARDVAGQARLQEDPAPRVLEYSDRLALAAACRSRDHADIVSTKCMMDEANSEEPVGVLAEFDVARYSNGRGR